MASTGGGDGVYGSGTEWGEGPPSAEEGLADVGQLLFLPEVLLCGPFQSA